MKKIATTWSKPSAQGQAPRPRCSHASCVIDHQLVICGGWSSGNRFLDDVHIYSLESNTWTQPKMNGEGRVRVGHSMTPGEQANEIWVIGGTMGASSVLDVQLLNLETHSWSSPNLSGAPPEARSRHSANRFGQHIYLFGGGDNQRLFSDVWRLDLVERSWSIVPTQGTPPSGRWGHTATLVDTRLFVFGGHDGVHRLNDVHVLDLSTFTWFTPDCKAKTTPSPRSTLPSPASTTSQTGDEAMSSGGASDTEIASNPLATSSGSVSSVDAPSSSSPVSSELPSSSMNSNSSTKSSPIVIRRSGAAQTQNVGTLAASPQPSLISSSPVSGTASNAKRTASALGIPPLPSLGGTTNDGLPPARAGHSANCMGRKLIIYGGGDGKLLGDMYYLHVDTYEWSVMESGNVPDRCAHTSEVVHTPSGWRLLVFGGSNGIKTFNDLYLVTCSKNRVRAPSQKRKSNSLIRSNPSNDTSGSALPAPSSSPNTISLANTTHGSDDTNSLPPLSVNIRSTQNASPRTQSGPHSPKSPRIVLPTLSYKDALQNEPVPPKTPLKRGSSAGIPTSKPEPHNHIAIQVTAPTDRLYQALKTVGLEKYHPKFVEQEISFSQLMSLSESHLQSLGITTIREKALMAKLRENVQMEAAQVRSSAAEVSESCDAPTSYAAAVSAHTTKSNANHSIAHSNQGNTSDLVRKVQLSADALASAADSLRAAANNAIRAEE